MELLRQPDVPCGICDSCLFASRSPKQMPRIRRTSRNSQSPFQTQTFDFHDHRRKNNFRRGALSELIVYGRGSSVLLIENE